MPLQCGAAHPQRAVQKGKQIKLVARSGIIRDECHVNIIFFCRVTIAAGGRGSVRDRHYFWRQLKLLMIEETSRIIEEEEVLLPACIICIIQVASHNSNTVKIVCFIVIVLVKINSDVLFSTDMYFFSLCYQKHNKMSMQVTHCNKVCKKKQSKRRHSQSCSRVCAMVEQH